MDDLSSFRAIEDVHIVLRAELDRRTISVAELLRLEPGSVLTLNRAAGENVDVYAGNVLLGMGEILLIDARLAIRVADLAVDRRSSKSRENAHTGGR